jgi:hypothetical protein
MCPYTGVKLLYMREVGLGQPGCLERTHNTVRTHTNNEPAKSSGLRARRHSRAFLRDSRAFWADTGRTAAYRSEKVVYMSVGVVCWSLCWYSGFPVRLLSACMLGKVVYVCDCVPARVHVHGHGHGHGHSHGHGHGLFILATYHKGKWATVSPIRMSAVHTYAHACIHT